MNDPQKPDPNVFWCKKCQCHGDFVVKKKSASDSQGTSTWEIKCCKLCTAEGGEPNELKEELIVSASVFGGIILFVDGVIIAMIYKQVELTNPTFIVVVTSASLFLFALLWFAPRIGDILWFLKWKKWAKERG
jgi:hypothetical protein